MNNDRFMYKELVTVIIEKVLLEISFPAYNAIVTTLWDKHGCEISDCYENPGYLKNALEEYFGSASASVVDAINKDLAKAAKNETIEKFLEILNR